MMKTEKPDLVLAIDGQGFNMPFIKKAKKLGFKTAYFISPQEWQWGSDKGGKKVVKTTDLILSIFTKEHNFYKRLGGNTVFVGHPIYDIVKPKMSKKEFDAHFHIQKNQKILSVFPGSRKQEITHIAPTLLKAAKLVQSHMGQGIRIFVSVLSDTYFERLKAICDEINLKDVIFYTGYSVDLIKHTDLSLATSGTVTLEHGVLKSPYIALYKLSWLSFMVLRVVFAKSFYNRLRFISLPNLLLSEMIFPEFIQDRAKPAEIYCEAIKLLTDKKRQKEIQSQLFHLQKQIGKAGCIARVGEELLKLMHYQPISLKVVAKPGKEYKTLSQA